MLAENKESGIKLSIDNISVNFKKIEQNMDTIQKMELQKPHPDTQFNQEKQVKKNMESAKNVQSKMDDIQRLYINLKREDEEFADLQTKVTSMQSNVGKNQVNLNQIKKEIVQKENQNKQDGNVSDDDWNKQFGFVLSADS